MDRRSTLYPFSVACLALAVSACATSPSTSSGQKASTTLPAHSVVLMDPSIDDGMLPAIGEHLSNGAVTIYNLDGPSAALPIDVSPAAGTPTSPTRGPTQPIVSSPDFNNAPLMPMPGMAVTSPAQVTPLSIKRPAGMTPGDKDPRVTVFDVNAASNAPDSATGKSTRAPATDPTLRGPNLPAPLSEQTRPLKSPFTASGDLQPTNVKGSSDAGRDMGKVNGVARDITTWNPPSIPTGANRRAVTSENLMTSSGDGQTTKSPRPPKGMTY